MTNGSYEVNGKSNLGYVDNEGNSSQGTFSMSNNNGHQIETRAHKGELILPLAWQVCLLLKQCNTHVITAEKSNLLINAKIIFDV